jgi:phytoene dehydrogenase-like protein
MSRAAYDAIVIGAGANGLTAATALAKSQRRVLVVEREAMVGGTWAPVDIASGVSVPFEMESDWVPPQVALLLGIADGDFGEAPSTAVRVDNTLLTLPANADAAVAAIQRHSPRDAAKWPALVGMARQLSGFLEVLYEQPALDVDARSVGNLPSLLSLGRSFRALGRANMSELLRVLPMPVQDLADDFTTFEPLKALIAAAGIRDIRQGPRSGGTSFVLLHYLAGGVEGSIRGRRPLRAGPGSFIRAATRAAHAAGVQTRTSARVVHIDVANDAVRGVTLESGETIGANAVVSTADPTTTLCGLIDPVWFDPDFMRAVQNIRYRACTAWVAYTLGRLPDIPTGVISLSSSTDAIERAFDAAKYGEASPVPHIEICLRPESNALLARVQYIPHTLRDGAWDAARKSALANLVTAAIGATIPKFNEIVRGCRVFTPPDLEAMFGVREGALTQGEMGLDQILFMRPVAGWGRHAMPLAGLYLGGAGTHPGPGVAGGPGLLAARQVIADAKKRR